MSDDSLTPALDRAIDALNDLASRIDGVTADIQEIADQLTIIRDDLEAYRSGDDDTA